MARGWVVIALLGLVACAQGGATDTADSADTATSADTWTNYAQGFFSDYCVQCHSSSPRDFTQYADVSTWSAEIRCGVAATAQSGCGSWPPPKQFPIGNGPKPSDAERDRIVAWIDAGLPE